MAAERREFYQLLGALRTATGEEIQRAYRTLDRRNHPDAERHPLQNWRRCRRTSRDEA
jgi:curved DNA-binding protein